MMKAPALIAEIQTLFSSLKDETKAAQMEAYLRGQFKFLGIPTPLRRDAIKYLKQMSLSDSELFDCMQAIFVLTLTAPLIAQDGIGVLNFGRYLQDKTVHP